MSLFRRFAAFLGSLATRLHDLFVPTPQFNVSLSQPNTPVPVASLTIEIVAQQSTSVLLVAKPYSAAGVLLPGRVITWASSDNALAPIDASGLVTVGTGTGTAVISATCEGIVAEITVTIGGGAAGAAFFIALF